MLAHGTQEVLANLKSAIDESKAIITYDALPVVNADSTQLLQVFQNLIENAAKYTSRQTQPLIEIGTRRQGDQQRLRQRDLRRGLCGLPRAAYHFLTHKSPGAIQATAFLEQRNRTSREQFTGLVSSLLVPSRAPS